MNNRHGSLLRRFTGVIATALATIALCGSGCCTFTKVQQLQRTNKIIKRTRGLTQPPQPPGYCVNPQFHGYNATCWRPWPAGWDPCACACGDVPTSPHAPVPPGYLPAGGGYFPPGTVVVGEPTEELQQAPAPATEAAEGPARTGEDSGATEADTPENAVPYGLPGNDADSDANAPERNVPLPDRVPPPETGTFGAPAPAAPPAPVRPAIEPAVPAPAAGLPAGPAPAPAPSSTDQGAADQGAFPPPEIPSDAPSDGDASTAVAAPVGPEIPTAPLPEFERDPAPIPRSALDSQAAASTPTRLPPPQPVRLVERAEAFALPPMPADADAAIVREVTPASLPGAVESTADERGDLYQDDAGKDTDAPPAPTPDMMMQYLQDRQGNGLDRPQVTRAVAATAAPPRFRTPVEPASIRPVSHLVPLREAFRRPSAIAR